jgi:hypothetical protein
VSRGGCRASGVRGMVERVGCGTAGASRPAAAKRAGCVATVRRATARPTTAGRIGSSAVGGRAVWRVAARPATAGADELRRDSWAGEGGVVLPAEPRQVTWTLRAF